VRLFLAVNFPQGIRQAIWEESRGLRAAAPSVKWVEPELVHITMKFLGECETQAADAVTGVVTTVAVSHAPIPVTIRGIGAFPNFHRPRIVWAGVDDRGRLGRLATAIDAACTTLGFAPEQRAFKPHLTLGRVKTELVGREVSVLQKAAEGVRLSHVARIGSVDLMRSHLVPRGPRYEVMQSIPLVGTREGDGGTS
jgi:RNA 2',3'-cyclic 3'-phosphodiesterase